MTPPDESDPIADDTVLVETVGATRILTLNRPQARNALTLPMLAQARAALDAAAVDSAIRCVVVTGAGGHFCAGADLRQTFVADPAFMDRLELYMDAFHATLLSVARCEKPTIAMMDGAAVGFGADLAFACDLRVAASSAYAQEKFVQIGLMPDGGGTFWLPRLVGTARAMQMILLAERVDAAELHRLGVVVQVVESGKLRNATLALAGRIETGPPLAFAAIKHAVHASLGSLEDALRRERAGQLRLLRSVDAAEGVSAWAEKRPPRFEGK
jgi:2-(1,2-epoxy-1,2-dihydrophenyl)acetyl-CoA isomerase